MPDETLTETALTVTVSRQSLENLLGDGFDYGISYWCKSVRNVGRGSSALNAESHIVRGGTVNVYELDGESDAPRKLDARRVIQGALAYARLTGRYCLGDDGDYDVNDADAIIQLAAFGEIIYG
jgi:hypothetical protein